MLCFHGASWSALTATLPVAAVVDRQLNIQHRPIGAGKARTAFVRWPLSDSPARPPTSSKAVKDDDVYH
jgi:hypothetical protein